jgi:hypothetical protein
VQSLNIGYGMAVLPGRTYVDALAILLSGPYLAARLTIATAAIAVAVIHQLDLQAIHRVRVRLISRRTAAVNQLRAFLLERGMCLRRSRRS